MCIRDSDGIGAQGESANRVGPPPARLDFLQHGLAGQQRAGRVQRGQPAINVVVAGAAAGERELAEAKRFFRQHGQQLFA